MDPQRLVLVEIGGPDGGSGSGYLVGPQLVLTALHVVLNGGEWAPGVSAQVGHPRYGAGPVQRSAEVCWPDPRHGIPPEDALDVALLWLGAPVPTGGGPVRWGQPGGVAPVPFKGAGFPAFAAEDNGTEAQCEYLRGDLPVVSTATSGWVLDCPVWPAAGKNGLRPWAGASGSAIFCYDRLVGVAIEDNRAMDWRRLHAAPIHEALALPGFATLVNRHGHPGTGTTTDEVTADNRSAAPGETEETWPLEVGPVPGIASAFQPRNILRERVDGARAGGEAVVLTQVLSGGGGVGKTQLAAAYATDALKEGADLVVWAAATEAQQVITQYAQAAARIRLSGADGQDPQADAHAFLDWLATTSRRWLVVLDDITDPAALNGWWPVSRTGSGWVLATTRLNDARLTGGGRTRIAIDVYTPEESHAYLQARMVGDGMDHLLDDRAPALAEALGHLPLALSHAAAHMINEELTCSVYLALFTDRQTRLDQALPESADTEGYGRQITTTLLLSLNAAEAADHTGLAVPALRLAALLDPAGHPHALWTTTDFLDYLTDHRGSPTTAQTQQATSDQAHTALRLLHRYALLTCDTRAEPRAVRIHALTARAVRENTPAPDLSHLATTAADALLDAWPNPDHTHPELAAVLRANTDALADHTLHHLWHPEGHPLLFRAGTSLLNAGLVASATAYWQDLTTDCERLLGGDHPDTLSARGNLASSYQQVGRTTEAVQLAERVVADCERLLGGDHPDTLSARGNLASSYQQVGRTTEAVQLAERVVADCERLLGDNHPHTLTARATLASSYWQAGRTAEAIAIEERVVADREQLLGDDHPSTLTARANLASSYQQAGRTTEAIQLLERVAADIKRLLGEDHPHSLTARGNLASSYWQAGRTTEAIQLLERVVADCERLLGDNHPGTLTARANLASSYRQAGRTAEAVQLAERVAADRERLLGDDHPHTLTARGNLASSYQQAGRTAEAVQLAEGVAADIKRLLGDDHPHTLAARGNLASSYKHAGRITEAVQLAERVAADSGRLLGGDHPDTLTARGNLASCYQQVGRTAEAVQLAEGVAADCERLLGDDHPDTLTARGNLASCYRQVGRTAEAVQLAEGVAADCERLLGDDHPDTLT
ncbi:tetratricopeptide repeat protein, partial [Streptomyces sp. NPDC026665]|uniref:tetratricopeptide repeat protein n=1 Tax=Streptomyces sp. NPDC026665 TaxID=3154798 RepID=UPI0033E5B879